MRFSDTTPAAEHSVKTPGSPSLTTFVLIALMWVSLPLAARPALPTQWTTTWGTSQLKSTETESLARSAVEGATVRQVVHLSIGGSTIRLRLSNAFGQAPLVLHAVEVALPDTGAVGAVQAASRMAVHFHNQTGVIIPAGAEYLSDPIALAVAPLSDLAITMMIESAPDTLTFHGGSRATSFLAKGDHVSDVTLDSPQTFAHWYFVGAVEVAARLPAVVTLGDSITDGHGATTDANDRWPDVLARRLAGSHIGVVNRGIGGNRILNDGLGPNMLARFDRDVLSTAGVRYLIILEGINDLGGLDRTEPHPQQMHDALVDRIEAGLQQVAERAHAAGIHVYGATLTPDGGSDYYHPSERSEADRQRLNQWIRTSPVFDAVVDFDVAVRDPDHPDRLIPAYDSGDHLHPGPAGYNRMGEAIPLALFRH